jgi:hypothetical protein
MTGRTDLDVSDPTKRVPLYALGLIGYAMGIATFLALNNKLMFVMAVAYLCVGPAMCLITLGWKTSAHTAGIAGPTTALVLVFGIWVAPLFTFHSHGVGKSEIVRTHTEASGGRADRGDHDHKHRVPAILFVIALVHDCVSISSMDLPLFLTDRSCICVAYSYAICT